MVSVGGIPQEDLKQILVDRMELDIAQNWSMNELLQRFIKSGLWVADLYETGTIANAENRTAVATVLAVSPAKTAIPGLVVVVPPTDRDLWLEWKGLISVDVAGQGIVALTAYDVTNGISTPLDTSGTRVAGTDPTAVAFDPQAGSVHIGLTKTVKVFALYGNVIREAASALDASVYNGNGANRSFLTAVAR